MAAPKVSTGRADEVVRLFSDEIREIDRLATVAGCSRERVIHWALASYLDLRLQPLDEGRRPSAA